MKLAVITHKNNILEYSKLGANAFIFGLKDFSSGYNNEIDIDTIKEIKEHPFYLKGKEFFEQEFSVYQITKDINNKTSYVRHSKCIKRI